MRREKQLTRMFNDNTTGVGDPDLVERAISVVSSNTIHSPGSMLNNGDLMLAPASDVIDVSEVGDHLVAIKPYGMYVKHGNGFEHNSIWYNFDRTIVGEHIHVCHNNRDTILIVAYNNPTIKVIEITEDGIVETNMSPFPDQIILNCACIEYAGQWSWWIWTSDYIYYNDSLFTGFTQKATPASKATYYTPRIEDIGRENIILTSYYASETDEKNEDSEENATDYRIATYIICSSNYSMLKFYTASKSKNFGGYRPTSYTSLTVLRNIRSCDFPAFQLVNPYNAGITTMHSYAAYVYRTTANKVRLVVFQSRGSAALTDLSADIISNKTLNIDFGISDDIRIYPAEESTSIATICISRYDSNQCEVYNLASDYQTVSLRRKINLKSNNYKMFNTEAPYCFRTTRRDMGDEIYYQTKCFYHSNGLMEFYSKGNSNNGFFYIYTDHDTSQTHIHVRRKIDVSNKLIVSNTSNEYHSEYTGEEATETISGHTIYSNTLSYTTISNSIVPKYIRVQDVESGRLAHIFPHRLIAIVEVPDCAPLLLSGDCVEKVYTENVYTGIKIRNFDYAFEGEGVMNKNDKEYTVYAVV